MNEQFRSDFYFPPYRYRSYFGVIQLQIQTFVVEISKGFPGDKVQWGQYAAFKLRVPNFADIIFE